jgi:hypothetical protein
MKPQPNSPKVIGKTRVYSGLAGKEVLVDPDLGGAAGKEISVDADFRGDAGKIWFVPRADLPLAALRG